MSAPDLRLPPNLLPDAVTKAKRLRVTGTYYRAVPSPHPLDLTLPMKAWSSSDKPRRFSVPGIVDGLYLASDQKTTMCEVWSPGKLWQKRDLYSVAVDVSNIFDLRDTAATSWLEHDCFRLGLPPNPTHRNYVAWHYLTYAVWSAGFAGIISKSHRYAGDVLYVHTLEGGSFVRKGKLLDRASPDEWVKKNP